MKKLCIILVIALLVSGCSNKYDTWKEINLPDVGSFKIPEEWVYNEKDNIICLCNKNIDELSEPKIYLIGAIYEENEYLELISDFCNKKIEYKNLISSAVFSNNATTGKVEYSIDNELYQLMFLRLRSNNKHIYFIVCDEGIEYGLVEKVAKSFKMQDMQ